MNANSLVLDIAGVTVAVDLPWPAWRSALREHYVGFLADGPAAWQVQVREDTALAGGTEFWIRHRGACSTFRAGAYGGTIDLAERRAVITAPASDRARSAVERITAYVCMLELPTHHQGILLHGAAIAWLGEGHAFCGASGSGKTTLAALAAGYAETLVDENLALRRAGEGFELLSTPFWGVSTPPERIRRVNRVLPLRAVYLLRHAAAFRLRRLTAASAVAELLTTEKVPMDRAEVSAAWLDVAGELVKRVPVYDLGFRPSVDIWDFLADALQVSRLP